MSHLQVQVSGQPYFSFLYLFIYFITRKLMDANRAQRSHIRPIFVQHLIVVDNTEELRLSKLLAEEAAKREKTVRTFKEDMEKLHLECIAYKQQVERLKRELDDERTKYPRGPLLLSS